MPVTAAERYHAMRALLKLDEEHHDMSLSRVDQVDLLLMDNKQPTKRCARCTHSQDAHIIDAPMDVGGCCLCSCDEFKEEPCTP
jgi:hypothetical protein